MPNNTYVELQNQILGTATSTITFSSIPSTYTDLVIVANLSASAVTYSGIRFNGDTGSNYSLTDVYGTGSGAVSSKQANITGGGSGDTSGTGTVLIYQIMNYSNTNTFKTVLSRNGSSSTNVVAGVSLWRNTAAINSITIYSVSGNNWNIGSTFSLYGIRAEGTSPTVKATGGAVYSDDVYYYHAFGASGTFTPTQSITADVLVVAGGAGGGRSGGGGGAGGYLAFTSQALTATGYTVTVGSGGAGNNTDGQTGTSGGDSQFGALTLVKGGGGGGSYGANGATGGSGGGGGGAEGSTRTGGSATPSGQGSAGGNGFNGTLSTNRAGGGGGGAGGVGSAATSAIGGSGGIGLSTYSSWGVATGVGQNVSGTYYLSGGGAGYGSTAGGSAGLGGGGARGVNGTANTGGGGGGSASDGTTGFSGGSGVVIVRYAK